jgi:hypothetical protein
MGGSKESMASVTPSERPSANVTNGVYDAASNETPPPCGVAGIRVEPMDPAAAELLARDLLELLEWARTGKE